MICAVAVAEPALLLHVSVYVVVVLGVTPTVPAVGETVPTPLSIEAVVAEFVHE